MSNNQILDWAKSYDINGFNIYRMARTNIIRIHEVNHSKCSHAINVGDAIIQIDGITIDNWSYKDLTQYLCSTVIASIEAIGYFHYKKRKLNNVPFSETFDAPISNVPLLDTIEVAIEPPLTSQLDLCNIDAVPSLSNVPIPVSKNNIEDLLSNVPVSHNIEDVCNTDNNIPDFDTKRKRKRIKPNDVNGFDIYINHQTKIIRIFSVSENCKHNIIPLDVVLKVDNIPIDNWSYRNLRKYLSQNIITSIETQDYSTYKRQRLNTDNAISIDTPVSDFVVTNNNTFNSSGTFLFTVNIYLLTLLFVTVSPIDLSAELSN
jgi:hypothetical protein